MPVFLERDLEEPWWKREPAPNPGEGPKLVSRGRELLVMIEDRRYRVRARASVIGPQHLQLHLWLWLDEARQYFDAVDLYNPNERRGFVAAATAACNLDAALIEQDLAFIVRHCEPLREAMLQHLAGGKERSDATLQ